MLLECFVCVSVFFFKQKTAYEMRISDWSSDVCSSDLNDALNTLKDFCENAPEYAVTSAGSLLGVVMSRGQSFPVGKVTFLQVNPISFAEFLSIDSPQLFDYLDGIDKLEPLPDIFFNPLVDKLKTYFISGGMPESVATLAATGDVDRKSTRLNSSH